MELAMNGWWIALIVYAVGFVGTYLFLGFTKSEEDKWPDPADDDAMDLVVSVIWPVTLVVTLLDHIADSRKKKSE
jgi:hypothetical protein